MSKPPPLDSFVILKGSQLNLVHHHANSERLPASAGLPSAAGLYRSHSHGGDSLNGIANEMKLLSNLITSTRKLALKKPSIRAMQKSKSIPSNKQGKMENAKPVISIKRTKEMQTRKNQSEETVPIRTKSLPIIATQPKRAFSNIKWSSWSTPSKSLKKKEVGTLPTPQPNIEGLELDCIHTLTSLQNGDIIIK